MVWLACQSSVVAAEDAGVQEIKKLYAQTAAAIALAQKSEVGGLYCSELIVNSRGGSWRAVGNYVKKAVFWYSDQPEFAEMAEQKAETVLAKVEVSETSAARFRYSEFLYAGGRLRFFFRSDKNGDEPALEERVYFWDNRLPLRLPGPGNAAALPVEAIFKEAQYWQRLFLLSFAE